MKQVILQKGKDKAVRHQHPWIFSGAIKTKVGNIENGDLVEVLNADGETIAFGVYNNKSRVAIRLLAWGAENVIDEQWWRQRVRTAIESRLPLLNENNDSVRLIFAESDFLPGLIADKYADFISIQVHSSALEKVKAVLIDEMMACMHPKGIYERSDLRSRETEGLPDTNGLTYGEMPPEFVEIKENGIRYKVNIADGQKSGFYCDQRENRWLTAQYAKGKNVLDCFSYSGGFTLNALRAGASSVTAVDSSALALETLQENANLNEIAASRLTVIKSDVNQYLRSLVGGEDNFDLIILDPPKYAPSRTTIDKASRAYKDLNRCALLLLKKGGLLATFSCSSAMDIASFKQVLAWAALDAGKEIQIIRQFSQADDHPVRASFPEGEYLKGLMIRVL